MLFYLNQQSFNKIQISILQYSAFYRKESQEWMIFTYSEIKKNIQRLKLLYYVTKLTQVMQNNLLHTQCLKSPAATGLWIKQHVKI